VAFASNIPINYVLTGIGTGGDGLITITAQSNAVPAPLLELSSARPVEAHVDGEGADKEWGGQRYDRPAPASPYWCDSSTGFNHYGALTSTRYIPASGDYSWRRAIIGSTRIARRAGT